MTIGLLLEGGGMRGLYTSGVLDVLLDHDIAIDEVVGVSAGALFGVNFISKQRGRALRYNQQYLMDKRYMGYKHLLTTGNFINTQFAFYDIPMNLDVFDNDTFKESHTTMTAVVTNIDTGQPEYFLISDVFEQMELLRATGALPFISKPVAWDGQLYLDGGIANSIPIAYMRQKAFDKLIVVLTQPDGFVKKESASRLNDLFYRKYPNLVNALKNRHNQYNDALQQISQLEQSGDIFVIRPSDAISIGRLEKNPEALESVYHLGIEDMTKQLQSLKDYLLG